MVIREEPPAYSRKWSLFLEKGTPALKIAVARISPEHLKRRPPKELALGFGKIFVGSRRPTRRRQSHYPQICGSGVFSDSKPKREGAPTDYMDPMESV